MAKWRTLFLVYAIVMLVLAFRTVAHAAPAKAVEAPKAPKSFSCRVATGDIGQIVTTGKDANEAREKASEVCFDRRIALYERHRGGVPGQEQGDDIIDSCVNVRCL